MERGPVFTKRELRKTSAVVGLFMSPIVEKSETPEEEGNAVTCLEAEAGNSEWPSVAVKLSGLLLEKPGGEETSWVA